MEPALAVDVRRQAGSFRDPAGFVFERDGVLLRQVNREYREPYDALLQSELYDELTSAGLLIRHREIADANGGSLEAYRVIQPDRVAFISYPYEWSFSQLRDAALVTLDIQRRAIDRGLSLKDASAFNIQFHEGRAVLIDTLSFEIYREGAPWTAYGQFCRHFLAPLLLMSMVDVRLGGLLKAHLDGIPLDLASRLLPRNTWLRFGALLHLHLHARSLRRYALTRLEHGRVAKVSRTALLGFVDSLRTLITKSAWRPEGTEWAEYGTSHNYSADAEQNKIRLVRSFLEQIRPAVVWDLGANTGMYSRVAADLDARVISFDVDPAAVERNYLEVRRNREQTILPLLLDLTDPSPGRGWANAERASLAERGPADLVMSLALLHHLVIANNLPMEHVAAFFARLAPSVIVEFVPKSDSQVERLMLSRPDIFPGYTRKGFEEAFGQSYRILRAEPIRSSDRWLYLMIRRSEG